MAEDLGEVTSRMVGVFAAALLTTFWMEKANG
jgi:hypothetical protein